MIYAAFTFWLFLILFTGTGVYRLWTRLGRPKWVNWALLPGTVVSEMAYIFGCLITGGEVHRVKLIPKASEKGGTAGEPTTEAAAGLKHVGPVIAALISIVACIAALLLAHALLGKPVIRQFVIGEGLLSMATLPKELPGNWEVFWQQVAGQVTLLKRMCETWRDVDWLDWRVVVFIYLSLCLAVRLSPVSRPIRPTLVAVVAIAAVIALVGLIWRQFGGLMGDLWPLLTYIWALLLFALAVTLLLMGIAALARIVLGKSGK